MTARTTAEDRVRAYAQSLLLGSQRPVGERLLHLLGDTPVPPTDNLESVVRDAIANEWHRSVRYQIEASPDSHIDRLTTVTVVAVRKELGHG